tara:strand:+ start:902 stop:1387 length:486 start_codon:yes stop_codon:yes gene_type:complete
MKNQEVNATFQPGEGVTFEKTKKPKLPHPPYVPLGQPGKLNFGIEGFPSFGILRKLSGNSSWLLWSLAEIRDPKNNLCDVDDLRLSKKEKNRIPRAYKELRDAYLITRVKNGLYLINPKFIFPKFERMAETWEKWCELRLKHNLASDPLDSLASFKQKQGP